MRTQNRRLQLHLRMFGDDMRSVQLIHQREQVIRLYSRPERYLQSWGLFWSKEWQLPYAYRVHEHTKRKEYAFLPDTSPQIQADIINLHEKTTCTSTSGSTH